MPPTNYNIKILWDDSIAAYRVSTPFSPQFVELLKQLIPAGARAWDIQTKVWTVEEKYGVPIFDLCARIWSPQNILFVDAVAQAAAKAATAFHAQQNTQAQPSNYQYVPPKITKGDPLDLVMLNFFKTLPYDAAKAAYRNAALLLHPDRQGGSADKMTVLNMTWTRIEQEYYGKVKP